MVERHFPLARLQKALHGDGIACVILPDAQGKSARAFANVGYYVGCQAIDHHHSVSSGLYPANDIDFINGGKGPGYIISNAYTGIDGTVYLIASGPTYTAGSGGPWGIIPKDRLNDTGFSNEIASWGAVDSEYPARQQDAVLAFGYHAGLIAADVWDWDDDPFGAFRQPAHFEWAPERKIDPRGISRWSPQGGMWDMDAFRADLHSYAHPEEDDMRTLPQPLRAYDSRQGGAPFAIGETREVTIGMTTEAFVNVTVVGSFGTSGYVSLNDDRGRTSLVNYSAEDRTEANSGPVLTPNGKITVTNHGGVAHVIVDVYAQKP